MEDIKRRRGRPRLTKEEKAEAIARRTAYLRQYYQQHKETWPSSYVPSDYSRATIYRVFSPETDKFYIGSTSRPLKHRLEEHRRCILRRANRLYETMADLSLVWEIEPLMVCEAEDRTYLEQLELMYICAASCDGEVLNTNKRYSRETLRCITHFVSLLKVLKSEHLPEVFRLNG
jgi:hypothetical protein